MWNETLWRLNVYNAFPYQPPCDITTLVAYVNIDWTWETIRSPDCMGTMFDIVSETGASLGQLPAPTWCNFFRQRRWLCFNPSWLHYQSATTGKLGMHFHEISRCQIKHKEQLETIWWCFGSSPRYRFRYAFLVLLQSYGYAYIYQCRNLKRVWIIRRIYTQYKNTRKQKLYAHDAWDILYIYVQTA